MKPTLAWHRTWPGRVCLWLGSVELAVPVLATVAIALAVGTWLESTRGTRVAREWVYGSWWFVALMGLVCLSLIFAVVTRFPWKRRHVGFMTVHASLIALIAGGLWSMWGRVEGHLALREGMVGSEIELDEERLDLLDHAAGMTLLGSGRAPAGRGEVRVAGVAMRVEDRWENVHEESVVSDDGPDVVRAIEIRVNDGGPEWVGEESKSGGPATIARLRVRVLADGAEWSPPAEADQQAGLAFTVGEARYPLSAEGAEAFPGWRIVSIKTFSHAVVSGSSLGEGGEQSANPAVDVTITDDKGTVERHTAFENFPDMVMGKTLSGTGTSGARLAYPKRGDAETLVVFGPIGATQVGYVGTNGAGRVIGVVSALPWASEAGAHRIRILRQFARAQMSTRYTKAPPANENRTALVVRMDGAAESVVVPWKGSTPISADNAGTRAKSFVLHYGPATLPLPFSVKLDDFRKTDYPGTEMAMAYESEVTIAASGGEERRRISMNNPYAGSGWKVYQSGFMGEDVSIFSVMKDPGLGLTYIGSIFLCVGIVVTFYSRALSWGHPGMTNGTRKESGHASAAHDVRVVGGVGVGVERGHERAPAVDGAPRAPGDPGRRAGDPAGELRATPGGAAHGADAVVR